MTQKTSTGADSPPTETAVLEAPPDRRIRLGSPVSLLAIVPHLLGFMPDSSLVVIGAESPRGEIKLTLRYDLPDPPGEQVSRDIAAHATEILATQRVEHAIVIGYGAAKLFAPLADALRRDALVTGITISEVLRVEGQRYWSYLCESPGCCPPEGTVFDMLADPAWSTMTETGNRVLDTRADLAAAIAAVDGADGEAARRATQRAEDKAAKLVARVKRTGRRSEARRIIAAAGIQAVTETIAAYRAGRGGGSADRAGRGGGSADRKAGRGGGRDADRMAWLTLVLRDLRVRDDAWARMDPEHREAHLRMWTDLTRQARPGYVAAPAALLAFVAWQCGNGALANVALDRALADQAGYSMAQLLRQVIDGGVPPSAARLPMTPEEVAASYDEIDTRDEDPGEGASVER